MILESHPWKQELLKHADSIDEILDNYTTTIEDEEELHLREFQLERAVFYSAYIIRKLIEQFAL